MKVSTLHRRLVVAVVAVVAVPLIAGCGAGTGSDSGKPSVVASFYPLQYVAERIAGEHAEVHNLTSPGVEPHDLELSVRQTAQVSDADLVLYQDGFQPAVDDAVEQNGPDHVVEATEVVPLKRGDGHEDEAENHADHEGGDPHFWLDPARLGKVAAAFAEQMSEVDPAGAAAYATNLEELRHDLDDLGEEYRTGLAECELETVVVSHDAFGYLKQYGLRFEAVNGLSPGAEPSPARIAALHDLIESKGITTVFSETLATPELAESLAGDLGLETGVLDPIEGLAESTEDEDYLSLMRQNLAALEKANRC